VLNQTTKHRQTVLLNFDPSRNGSII